MTQKKTWKWNPNVACRTLEGTAFILLNSRMLSLNEVGTFLWDRLENGSCVEALSAEVENAFDTTQEEAQGDTQVFVNTLIEKELLIEADA